MSNECHLHTLHITPDEQISLHFYGAVAIHRTFHRITHEWIRRFSTRTIFYYLRHITFNRISYGHEEIFLSCNSFWMVSRTPVPSHCLSYLHLQWPAIQKGWRVAEFRFIYNSIYICEFATTSRFADQRKFIIIISTGGMVNRFLIFSHILFVPFFPSFFIELLCELRHREKRELFWKKSENAWEPQRDNNTNVN